MTFNQYFHTFFIGCCVPQETTYSWNVIPNQSTPGDYSLECTNDVSSDWCKLQTCMVDLRFISEYWELTNNGLAPDFTNYAHPDHSSNPGSFDVQDCPHDPQGGLSGAGHVQPQGNTVSIFDTKVCCGDYPYRFWYLTTSDGTDDRDCCEYEDIAIQSGYGNYPFLVGAMFHDSTQECCDDGPKVIGSCP